MSELRRMAGRHWAADSSSRAKAPPRARRALAATSKRGRRAGVALVSALALAVTGVGFEFLPEFARGGDILGPKSSDGSVNVLLIGLDSRKDQNGDDLPASTLAKLHAGDGQEGGYNTNTLILIHIPMGGKAVAFSIPRDDYVSVRGIEGYHKIKIKEAYGLKKFEVENALAAKGVADRKRLEREGREAGRQETLQTVRDLLGVPIDQYAEVNLVGFYDVAKALGGIEVCLNHAVYDDYSGANFPAGRQTLDASQALAFVRQRHGLDNGDLDRTHRQQAFLAGVEHKLSSSGTLSNLGELQSLVSAAQKDVVLSPNWDVVGFIQQIERSTGGGGRIPHIAGGAFRHGPRAVGEHHRPEESRGRSPAGVRRSPGRAVVHGLVGRPFPERTVVVRRRRGDPARVRRAEPGEAGPRQACRKRRRPLRGLNPCVDSRGMRADFTRARNRRAGRRSSPQARGAKSPQPAPVGACGRRGPALLVG